MLRIVAVECVINSLDVANIKFDRSLTLLDADVVVLDPSDLDRFWSHSDIW